MSPTELPDRDTVTAMARAQGLDLPAERLAALVRTFSDFVTKFDAVWQIDPGEHEPTAITFDDEAR